MSKEVDVPRTIEKVEFLDYHGATCPHCGKQIFVPQYRQQPITLKEFQKRSKETLQKVKKELG